MEKRWRKVNWGVPATVTVLSLSVFVSDSVGAVIVAFLRQWNIGNGVD